MTSSNGNIFHVTGPLWWGESSSHRWIRLTKASDMELWRFLWSAPEQAVEQTMETIVFWDAIAHYDVTVMSQHLQLLDVRMIQLHWNLAWTLATLLPISRWSHQMETFSMLLCVGNSLVTGEFPSQRPVTGCFDMGQAMELRLSCYLVLRLLDSKTR